jgi:hypothetical protein
VDIETRRKKQQDLIMRMVERKVRSRAQELYESRGQSEGRALEDWFQAESEVLTHSGVAPLYRRLAPRQSEHAEGQSSEMTGEEVETCKAGG